MKALVFGASGQLGTALRADCPLQDVSFLDRSQVDLRDATAVGAAISTAAPAVVINAAAYTAVDRAESERDAAYAINEAAPAAMARACADIGARLIHVSTDYVFDGRNSHPYSPEHPTAPLSVYGASKLAGERAIAAVPGLNHLTVRTSWVYGATGRNFLLTMLKLGPQRKELRVVADQVGTPTSAASLAHCLWRAVDTPDARGLLHFSDGGVASWYDFAVAIFEEALAHGMLAEAVTVQPCTTAEYPTPTQRPAYSVLDKTRTHSLLRFAPVHWRVNLRRVLDDLQQRPLHV